MEKQEPKRTTSETLLGATAIGAFVEVMVVESASAQVLLGGAVLGFAAGCGVIAFDSLRSKPQELSDADTKK